MTKKPSDANDVVQTTLRMRRGDWETLSMLAIRERTSLQRLQIESLNLLLKKRGIAADIQSP